MKLLETIATVVTKLDCDSRGEHRINTADFFNYPRELGQSYEMGRDWMYLGFGDTDINVGDAIKIDTYHHLPGDTQGDHTFATKGVHEVVTKLNTPLSSSEWADFARFIAGESTHSIGSYPEDGYYHQCPYSTMNRAIGAFRCFQQTIKDGTYDWTLIKMLRDVNCSCWPALNQEPEFEEQENPEPDCDD